MYRAFLFVLGNALAGWILAGALSSRLVYPENVPVRMQPQVAALVMALVFSLISLAGVRLIPRLRVAWTILGLPVSIAAAGSLLFSLDRAAGALIALSVAQHSPVALAAGAGWALFWSFLLYPPVFPASPSVAGPAREELPVSDNWSGAER